MTPEIVDLWNCWSSAGCRRVRNASAMVLPLVKGSSMIIFVYRPLPRLPILAPLVHQWSRASGSLIVALHSVGWTDQWIWAWRVVKCFFLFIFLKKQDKLYLLLQLFFLIFWVGFIIRNSILQFCGAFISQDPQLQRRWRFTVIGCKAIATAKEKFKRFKKKQTWGQSDTWRGYPEGWRIPRRHSELGWKRPEKRWHTKIPFNLSYFNLIFHLCMPSAQKNSPQHNKGLF